MTTARDYMTNLDEYGSTVEERANRCGDCGRPCYYDYDDEQYHHAWFASQGCFLIADEPGRDDDMRHPLLGNVRLVVDEWMRYRDAHQPPAVVVGDMQVESAGTIVDGVVSVQYQRRIATATIRGDECYRPAIRQGDTTTTIDGAPGFAWRELAVTYAAAVIVGVDPELAVEALASAGGTDESDHPHGCECGDCCRSYGEPDTELDPASPFYPYATDQA